MLECYALSKSFGGVEALRDFSVSFPGAGAIGIIGPNGSGKTTLLNLITGFSAPNHGYCRWEGAIITNRSPHEVCRLGVSRTFQDLRLCPALPAIDHVLIAFPDQPNESLAATLFKWNPHDSDSRARVLAMEILKLVGIEGKSRAEAANLSYGQQKLLALACCIATRGKVLLLDEPVAGIDPTLRRTVQDLIKELAKDQLVIVVEHDMDTIRTTCNRTLLLSAGEVIGFGPTAEILNSQITVDAYLR